MKEINLIPKWYQENKKHRSRCYIKYIAFAAVFVLAAIIWISAEVYVTSGKNRLARLEKENAGYEEISNKYEMTAAKLNEIKKKAAIMNKINSQMDITSMLGEISFLLEDALIIKKVEVTAEPFAENAKAAGNSSGLRVTRQHENSSKTYEGNVKFKISLNGIASEAGKVADLICKLEDSPYFFKVVPSFSQNKTVSSGQGQPAYYATEFEISCYLANFSESTSVAADLWQQ
ncbi:MAG: hypothetical protein PHF37_09965 [Phycisphaerae bacterium]|nr:hypothetical protein [Phycisphaerae bacterium]